ncbi:MAG: hypothetical protein ABR538_06355 [Candidatus Binatia bacterium]
MKRSAISILISTLIALPGSGAWAAQAITTCGQETIGGVLTGDLDCSGVDVGVTVLPGGSLDLAGHALVMGQVAGVVCLGSCVIDGNVAITKGQASANEDRGTMLGSALDGIVALSNTSSLDVANIHMQGTTSTGISAHRATLRNCTIGYTADVGISVTGRLTLTDSTVAGHDVGVVAGKRVSMVTSSITGAGHGILTPGRVSLADHSTVQGHDIVGIRARAVRATDSQINSSGEYLYVEQDHCLLYPEECGDIFTVRKPKLSGTTCDKSSRVKSSQGGQVWELTGQSWETCSQD